MTTENFTGAPPLVDPHQSMGEGLVALQKRNRFIQGIKSPQCGRIDRPGDRRDVDAAHFASLHAGALQRHPARRSTTLYVPWCPSPAPPCWRCSVPFRGCLPIPLHNGIAGFYVSLVRGTPLLIQIYLIYLGLPQIGEQITQLGFPAIGKIFILDAVPAGILALSLNYGAYMTEIFRAGLQSIGYGQREAAIALGMTPLQVMRRISCPRRSASSFPDVGNQFIAMQKDSALVSVMGVWEITYIANRYARRDSNI